MDRVARRGALARAPGALKGGHLSTFLSTFLSQLKGEPIGEKKQIFGKKSHSAEKN